MNETFEVLVIETMNNALEAIEKGDEAMLNYLRDNEVSHMPEDALHELIASHALSEGRKIAYNLLSSEIAELNKLTKKIRDE